MDRHPNGAADVDVEPPPIWFRLLVALVIFAVLSLAAADFYGWIW